MPLTTIDAERFDPAYSQQLCTLLEDGHLLLLAETPFLPGPASRALLCGTAKSGGRAHKNIAYRPHRRQLTGADTADAEEALLLQEALADYSERALAFLARLLPRYAAHWKVDYASFRPEEEAGRSLPLKRRNDLLHVDAFPTRPTHGGRILRVFTNLHSERDRVWVVSHPFRELAERYACRAGLQRALGPLQHLRRSVCAVAHASGLPVRHASAYDDFMLAFHHYLKRNADFQETGARETFAFPPGSSWICFTDQVAHKVQSGQYALEQTCIVPPSVLLHPEDAPLDVLKSLAGRPLVGRNAAAFDPR